MSDDHKSILCMKGVAGMYAVKVEQGRERPEVRKISTGFLPTYRVYTGSAAEKSVRWMVVPGYVFSLSMTRNAQPVPKEE